MKTRPRRVLPPQVRLVPFGKEHLENSDYQAWLRQPFIARRIGRPEYIHSFSRARIRQHVRQLLKTPGCHFFAVLETSTKKFIGTAKIQFFDQQSPRTGIADIGLMIGNSQFRGQGLSKEILKKICRFAFCRLRARKLTAGVADCNEAALRAFVSIGFRLEGRLRRQLALGGAPQDHLLLGCFPNELWKYKKSKKDLNSIKQSLNTVKLLSEDSS